MNIKSLSIPLLMLSLVGCGWVDSTGNQLDDNNVVVDPTVVRLDANQSVAIDENTQRTIVFNGVNKRITNWNWRILEGQARFDQCEGIDGFDLSIASNSLRLSCANTSACDIKVEEKITDNITQFQITTPKMRAPAALAMSFTAESANGDVVEERRTLCTIARNNPPVAIEDRATVLRGTQLNVSGGSTQSLLANDRDDIDVRNKPLRVDPTPIRAPRFAEKLQLFPDGGYSYKPLSNAPLSVNGSISDSFSYMVSDGNETSIATVSIKISDFNSAPVQIDAIPEITVTVDEPNRDLEIVYLQSYFSDPENDVMVFNIENDSLPPSDNLYITYDGVLEGYPTEDDVGAHFVTVSAGDSLESVEASFILNVVSSRDRNKSPTVDDISNKTVKGTFSYDVSEFFIDGDGDKLYFTSTTLPKGIKITPEGVIYGKSTSDNRGTWVVRIKADDGNGGNTDDGFRLTIK